MSAIGWALLERVLPLVAWLHLAGLDSPLALGALIAVVLLGVAVSVAVVAVTAVARRRAAPAPWAPRDAPTCDDHAVPAAVARTVAVGGRGARAPGRVVRRPAPVPASV